MRYAATILTLPLAVALAACGERQSDIASVTQGRTPASASLQRMTGLTHLPAPESRAQYTAALRRHYPRSLEDRGTRYVLVDVSVSETGAVTRVNVLPSPPDDPNVRVVTMEKVPGSNLTVERERYSVYDNAFGPAARAALQEVRFLPAIRDGKAVSHTVRMSVEFMSPNQPRG